MVLFLFLNILIIVSHNNQEKDLQKMSVSLPSIYLNKLKELFSLKSHTHNISDTNNLQTTLNGKASSSHNHDSSYAAKSHTHSASDISGLSTGIGFPDYANGSDITSDFKNSSSHGGANRYKASANGWIVCTPQSKVYVNGATFYTAHNGDAGLTNDSIFPVKSGDIVTGGASNMYFFPMR